MFKQTRRFLTVALYAAIPPWIASVIVTMAGAAVLSGTHSAATVARLFFASPVVVVPLLVGVGTVPAARILQRTGPRAMDRWPVAGLVVCVISLLFCFGTAGVAGDPLLGVWCLYSGYPVFVFAFTAYAWRRFLP